MKTAEKICAHEKSVGYRRHLKKITKRARRRAERHDPESAPTKNRYRGWST